MTIERMNGWSCTVSSSPLCPTHPHWSRHLAGHRECLPEPSLHKSFFFIWFWPILKSCLVSFSLKWLPYLDVIAPTSETQARPTFLPWLPTIPRIPGSSFFPRQQLHVEGNHAYSACQVLAWHVAGFKWIFFLHKWLNGYQRGNCR